MALRKWSNFDSFRVLQTLRHLVAMNENLKKQEAEFRAHCKDEMARLQDNINKLKTEGGDDTLNTEDQERNKMIQRQYDADKEKLHKIRLLLVNLK